jgi:redox-sensitive bicupin YhaK (pirin superfamily)
MIVTRPGDARGHVDHGWLDTRHTFSFANYHDPRHMGFRALRVINEDIVAPGRGFPPHSHRDMEIVTYVLAGGLEHQDSMGTRSVIVPGEVQRMSAGTGIRHSEFNASATEPVHFLQIWVLPDRTGLAPGYEQKAVTTTNAGGALTLVAARDGRHGALTIHADVDLYAAGLAPGTAVDHHLDRGRHAWVQLVRGAVELNGTKLRAGDGAAVSDERDLKLVARADTELLLFDLA